MLRKSAILAMTILATAGLCLADVGEKAEPAPGAPVPARGAGGPDAFGYRWIDSDEAGGPAYSWIEISGTGTPLDLADDGEANITSPFPFTFYGVTSTALRVGNNGGVLFDRDTGDVWAGNVVLPYAQWPRAMLVLWDDIDSDSGNVYWDVRGEAPNRRLVIEWHDRPHYSNTGKGTFELILCEGSNEVVFQYADLDFGNASYNNGISATVGIQGDSLAASNWFLQYSYNTASLHDGLAIRFHCNPAPVSADSMYFKTYNGTALMAGDKSANPAPISRTTMSFQYGHSVPCMDPWGHYIYEVYNANLRRFRVDDGTYVDFGLSHAGGHVCGTDGQYLYVPNGSSVHKYTMIGGYIGTTTLDIGIDPYSFAVVNDTVWASPDRYNHIYNAYPTSAFAGGSISNATTWDVGTGTNGTGNIAFDGTYYYIPWIGTAGITYKIFNRNRALVSTGVVTGVDVRSVMCRAAPRPILVFEETMGCPDQYYAQAAANLGFNTTITIDWTSFIDSLYNGTPWTMALVNNYGNYPSSYLDTLNHYIINGGRMIFFTWGFNANPSHPFYANLGASYIGDLTTPVNVHANNPADALFTTPNQISSLYWTDDNYGSIDCTRMSPSSGGVAVAYFEGYPGEAALMTNASQTALFNGFEAICYNGDDDGDGKLDMVELIENEITWLLDPVQVGVEGPSTKLGDPIRLMLGANRPNPFRTSTSIEFALPKAGKASLKVYNVLGQQVATLVEGNLPAGPHRASWSAKGVANGIYLYRLEANGQQITRKLAVIR